MSKRRWVIAFDKQTGKRMEFTVCDINNAEFYKANYELKGYDVKVLTPEESRKLAEEEKKHM